MNFKRKLAMTKAFLAFAKVFLWNMWTNSSVSDRLTMDNANAPGKLDLFWTRKTLEEQHSWGEVENFFDPEELDWLDETEKSLESLKPYDTLSGVEPLLAKDLDKACKMIRRAN